MIKIIVICLLLMTTVASADVYTIPHQSMGGTEIYTETYWDIEVILRLTWSYKREDVIFQFPTELHGPAEIYSLGFFVDQNYKIMTEFEANCYRKLYRYPTKLTESLLDYRDFAIETKTELYELLPSEPEGLSPELELQQPSDPFEENYTHAPEPGAIVLLSVGALILLGNKHGSSKHKRGRRS